MAVLVLTVHPEYKLLRLQSGGFELGSPGGDRVRAEPSGDGLAMAGHAELEGWRFEVGEQGLLLRRADGEEAGRSLRPGGGVSRDEAVSLLLDDGRLFRMVVRGPRDPRFDLIGWETDGAYLEARPCADGWAIHATVAGTELRGADGLLLLFAAELSRHDELVADVG